MFLKKKVKPDKWFDVASNLYRKGKLTSPYDTLFNYYRTVAFTHDGFKYGSDAFISDEIYYERLDSTIEQLRSVLPQHLSENFEEAVAYYKSLGEDFEFTDEVSGKFLDFDEVTNDHIEEIEDILKNHLRLLELA